MSRPPRFSYPGALHHVTLRCNNREFLFADSSFELFRQILQEGRAKFHLALYNYCLMTNHLHLLFKVLLGDTLSKAMHWVANTFSRRFNRLTGRNGHLWEGRFRSTIVEEASYFFRCMAYVDLNPVRAKMAATALEYCWSAQRAIKAEDKSVLDFHPLYLESGPDARARYESYLKLLAEEAARPPVSLATEYFVGTPKFVSRMVEKFGLQVGSFIHRTPLGMGLECLGARTGGRPPRV